MLLRGRSAPGGGVSVRVCGEGDQVGGINNEESVYAAQRVSPSMESFLPLSSKGGENQVILAKDGSGAVGHNQEMVLVIRDGSFWVGPQAARSGRTRFRCEIEPSMQKGRASRRHPRLHLRVDGGDRHEPHAFESSQLIGRHMLAWTEPGPLASHLLEARIEELLERH